MDLGENKALFLKVSDLMIFFPEKKENSEFVKKYRFHSDLLQNECLEPSGCPR